jgi:O-antigen ligase
VALDLDVIPSQSRIGGSVRRLLPWVLAVYLCLVWFGGGATVDVTHVDEVLAALALPVLLLVAACLLVRGRQRSRLEWSALAAAALVVMLPIVQLLPIPEAVWRVSPVRLGIAADLAIAGVQPVSRWSLWPLATERAAYALLPALALFVGGLAAGVRARRLLAPIALGLILANLFFGFFQAGLPPQSPLRLYQDNGNGFGGVLVNGNHQGTALIVGMLLALGLWAAERQKHDGVSPGWRRAAYAVSAVVCLAAIPLAGSSGAMLIALPALVAGVLTTGLLSRRRLRAHPWTRGAALALLAVMLLGTFSALQWLDVRSSDADRFALARDVATAAGAHAPLGSGAGTFVQSFAQSEAPSLQRGEYVNHAHNEYVQWWLEAGWLGIVALLSGLLVFLACGVALLRAQRRNPTGIACWLAVGAVLAHSWFDFPLRTLSMMGMSALLLGLAVAAASEQSAPERDASRSDAWPEPA